MAKKTEEPEEPMERIPSHRTDPSDAIRKALGITNEAMLNRKLNEILGLLWIPEGASKATRHERLLRALELYESLKPVDGAEGMLAMQMVGTHDAALDCLRRAALPHQTFEGRDMALKHAHKLMTLYTQQLAALNKHRGKGQQKVTVEHVNVAAGGQAIVGTVEAGQQQQGNRADDGERALEHQREVPAPEVSARSKSRRRYRSG